jgi:hypothetical protein
VETFMLLDDVNDTFRQNPGDGKLKLTPILFHTYATHLL